MNHIPLSLDANRIQWHRHFNATQRIGCEFIACLTIHAHTACSLIVTHIRTCTYCSLIVIHIHICTYCMFVNCIHTGVCTCAYCMFVDCHTYTYAYCEFIDMIVLHNTWTSIWQLESPWKNDLCTWLKIGRVWRSFVVVYVYYYVGFLLTVYEISVVMDPLSSL